MRVQTVFAHPGSKSFCHAVLERFDAGLRDANGADEATRRGYLDRAYALGREF